MAELGAMEDTKAVASDVAHRMGIDPEGLLLARSPAAPLSCRFPRAAALLRANGELWRALNSTQACMPRGAACRACSV